MSDVLRQLEAAQKKVDAAKNDQARLEGSLQQLDAQHRAAVEALRAEGFESPEAAAVWLEEQQGAIGASMQKLAQVLELINGG
jgi:hypothetical protein